MRIVLLFVIAFAFLFCRCSPDRKNAEEQMKQIFFDEDHAVPLYAVSYEFIPLETTERNLVERITRVEIWQDRIYVLEESTLRGIVQVYDRNGKFIQQLGSVGEGPGEYHRVINFYIDSVKQSIMVVDVGQSRLLFYDLNTYAHQRTLKIPFDYFTCKPLKDGSYLWWSHSGFGVQRDKYFFKKTDSTFINDPSYYHPVDFVPPYGMGRLSFYGTQNDSLLYFNYSSLVYKIDTEIKPLYCLSHSKYEFPTLDYLHSISSQPGTGYLRTLLHSGYIATYSLFETEDYFFINYVVNNKFGYSLYDRHNNKTLDLTDTFMKDGKTLNLQVPFVGVYKDRFIAHLQPNDSSIEYLKRKNIVVAEDDNPVLCLIKFN